MKEEFLNIFSDERNAKQDYIEVNFYTLLIGKKKINGLKMKLNSIALARHHLCKQQHQQQPQKGVFLIKRFAHISFLKLYWWEA